VRGLDIRCQRCSLRSPEELLYCTNCHARLIPKTKYDLEFSDYAYKPDLDAIATVKATGFLPYLMKRFTAADLEKRMVTELSAKALKIQYPAELDNLVRQCAGMLCLETLPEAFIVDGNQPNAFTFGTEHGTYLVLASSLLQILSKQELMAVIGHELGHIKSGHMLYHTLAEILAGGIGISASFLGLNAISIPLRLALLSWHRESEVTADRTSLLIVNDINVLKTLFHKLAGGAAFSQNRSQVAGHRVGIVETVGELLRTHPLYSSRLKLADQFWKSQTFQRALRKIRLRQSVMGALVPICRFCGQSKSTGDLFCPTCGRSLA
jgi:Zn-dependent protease with chaperone function